MKTAKEIDWGGKKKRKKVNLWRKKLVTANYGDEFPLPVHFLFNVFHFLLCLRKSKSNNKGFTYIKK